MHVLTDAQPHCVQARYYAEKNRVHDHCRQIVVLGAAHGSAFFSIGVSEDGLGQGLAPKDPGLKNKFPQPHPLVSPAFVDIPSVYRLALAVVAILSN